MKYNQKTHPLLLGILFGTAIYSSIVLAILYIVSVVVATVLIIPMCIMFLFVLISQIRNISSAKKEEDVNYCLNTYFIYKYITMPVELICAGMVGTFIVAIIGMLIQWLEEPLIIVLFFSWLFFYRDNTICFDSIYCNRVAVFYIN